jgi:type VI secretion system protein ImpJ
MLRLRTLNAFGARMKYLGQTPGVSPFMMYLELRELLGQLAALHPDRDQFDSADYDHDNLASCFPDLVQRIRALLRGSVQARFLSVPFANEGRMLTAALTDEHLNQPNDYFLGIKTRMDPVELAKLVEDGDKFKMMSRTKIPLRIFGIKLAEERHPPLEVPAQTGLYYFRLVRSESQRMWDAIKEEKSIAVRWPDMETSDFNMTLYMTVPG